MKWLLYICLFASLFSCKQSSVYSHEEAVPDPWDYDTPLVYEFESTDTLTHHQMALVINHDKDFGYQNVYVKIETEFPQAEKTTSVVSLDIGNQKGMFEGDCSGSSCEVEILLKSDFRFEEVGPYKISISQYGRTDELQGINSAELIIRKKVNN